jgi:hypothetical protein
MRVSVRARCETRDAHSALTLPHPAREVRVLKRHGVGEGEGELRADFICQETRNLQRAHPALDLG